MALRLPPTLAPLFLDLFFYWVPSPATQGALWCYPSSASRRILPVARRHQTPPDATGCHRTPQDATRRHQTPPDATAPRDHPEGSAWARADPEAGTSRKGVRLPPRPREGGDNASRGWDCACAEPEAEARRVPGSEGQSRPITGDVAFCVSCPITKNLFQVINGTFDSHTPSWNFARAPLSRVLPPHAHTCSVRRGHNPRGRSVCTPLLRGLVRDPWAGLGDPQAPRHTATGGRRAGPGRAGAAWSLASAPGAGGRY